MLNGSLCAQRLRTSRSSKTRLRSVRVMRARNAESQASAITFNKKAGSRSDPGLGPLGSESTKRSSHPSPWAEPIWRSTNGARPVANVSKARPARSRLLAAIARPHLCPDCGYDLFGESREQIRSTSVGFDKVIDVAAIDAPRIELFHDLAIQGGETTSAMTGVIKLQQVVSLGEGDLCVDERRLQ